MCFSDGNRGASSGKTAVSALQYAKRSFTWHGAGTAPLPVQGLQENL